MIPNVKKFILIFLLIMLPIQFSWAAAATYCQHEQETTKHFGHHEHQHDAAQANTDTDKDGSAKFTIHADCLNCHGASFGITPMPLILQSSAADIIVTAFNIHSPATIHPDRLERPKWVLAV